MRILVIPSWYKSDYKPHKGSFFREQALSLAKAGHEVALLHVHQYYLKDAWNNRWFRLGLERYVDAGLLTQVFHVPALPLLKKMNQMVLLACGKYLFGRCLSDWGEPDIVQLHSYRSGPIACWIKDEYGTTFVVTEHSSVFYRKDLAAKDYASIKRTYQEAARRFAVSPALVSRLNQLFSLDFGYLPNSVMDDFFGTVRKTADATFTFLHIGYLKKIKNQALLISAFGLASAQDASLRLIIIGDGPERKNLQELVSDLKMESRIELRGALDRSEVVAAMAEGDAFVLASAYETFGVVLIEALAAGLPVVSTRCGGPESIVADGSLGILCDIDETSLAEAMIRCRRTVYDRDRIRAYAYENFSEEVVVAKLTQTYRETAGEHA